MQFLGMLGPLMAGMGGNPDLDAQLQGQWQAQQLQSATDMAMQANQGLQQAASRATDVNMQGTQNQQQALASIVDGFRNSLLRGIR